MAGELRYQWSARGCDLERCMRIARNTDVVIPLLLPEFFSSFERLEGDGRAGTERVATLGPAITGGTGVRQNKERVLEYDEEKGTMVWELVDDARYSKFVTTMKVSCSNGEDSIIHWQMEYEPIDPSTLPPEDIKLVHLQVCKAIQKYADEHPEWP